MTENKTSAPYKNRHSGTPPVVKRPLQLSLILSNRVYSDLAILLFISTVILLAAYHYDATEALQEWSRRHERYEIDEILSLTLVLSIAFAVFSWRRIAELRVEITKRNRAEESMRHMAMHDAMTGLPNRAMLIERLQQELERAKRDQAVLALFVLDLDTFKHINDVYGHTAGDALLIETAQRLKDIVRKMDTVARLGGDEFAVIVPVHKNPLTAASLAARIVQAFTLPFDINGQELLTSISVGVTVSAPNQIDSDELLRSADVALYQAKSEGRSTHRFFDPDMDQYLQQRQQIERGLRNALSNSLLSLNFQPLFSIPNKELTGFEALLRWEDPALGQVPPDQFISIAEEIGLIHRIGEWVLREACRVALTWPKPLAISINVSPIQFRQSNLADRIKEVIAQSGLSPNRLEIEITESVLIENTEGVLATLKKLKDFGIRVAMDDFGTGYSSLGYLRKFPFDRIKIDRSFVSGLNKGNEDAAIVRAVAAMGQSLGMETLAEGVESEQQLTQLFELGCVAAQGFLLGRPMPEMDTFEFINCHKCTLKES